MLEKDNGVENQRVAERYLLAAHFFVELFDCELRKVQECYFLRQALPLVAGAHLVGHSVSDLASLIRSVGDLQGPACLAAHLSSAIQKYCKPSNEPENGSVKKKRSRRAGPKSPRPVNHPVLSSPLVLKSSSDFHSNNAQVFTLLNTSHNIFLTIRYFRFLVSSLQLPEWRIA
jgi:hypothetical protein